MSSKVMKSLYYVYFGTPFRAVVTLLLAVLASAGMLYIQQTRQSLIYVERVEELATEIEILRRTVDQNHFSTAFAKVDFEDLRFDEKVDPEVENRLFRQLYSARYSLEQGDTKYAQSLYNESLEMAHNKTALYNLGVLSYLDENYSNAIASWRRVIDEDPGDAFNEISFYLVLAAQQSGDRDAESEYLQYYLASLSE